MKIGSNNEYDIKRDSICHSIEQRINHLRSIISIISITPSIIILIFWVLLITTYVIGRNFFHLKWTFVEEFTGYMMVFVGYMTLAYVSKIGRHVRVKFVINRLSNTMQSVLDIITSIFVALPVLSYLIWRSYQWFYYGFEKRIISNNLHISLWPFYILIPIGLSLYTIEILLDIILKIIKFTKNRSAHDIGP